MAKMNLSWIKMLLGISVIESLVVFAGVGWICLNLLGLSPLWSAIIAMFSTFGTLTATWLIGMPK